MTIADGVYREWVNPPRGGTSEEKRITYRTAEGAHPILTGGEPLTGWEEIGGGIWKLRVPDALLRSFRRVQPVPRAHQGRLLPPAWAEALKGKAIPTPKATDLGVAIIPKQPFEEAPGKPFPLDRDLTGAPRAATSLPGPYATLP